MYLQLNEADVIKQNQPDNFVGADGFGVAEYGDMSPGSRYCHVQPPGIGQEPDVSALVGSGH